MALIFDKSYPPPGTAPGTLSTDDKANGGVQRIQVSPCIRGHWSATSTVTIEDVPPTAAADDFHWIDVQGTPSVAQLHRLGERLGLHPLAMEDVLNTGQRPKADDYDTTLTMILGLPLKDDDGALHIHQISLFLGKGFVLSITSNGHDPFPEVRRRLQGRHGRHITEPDDLLYALIDAAVDHAYPVLDAIGERVDALEEAILDNPGMETLHALHGLKRELIVLRRHLWPTREVINQLLRDHADVFTSDTLLWMRDVYDHTVQVMDLVESYRDMIASLLDVYLSSMSNRLNESIRRLTVIATIFMPLTFIVGVYGMNFEHPNSPFAMPELGWYWGYPMVWLVIIGIAGFMIWRFKRMRWF
ncbi:magnesium transporter [Natronocella acetinitrilica]|uniref:Magnesium transport protein CorA n=1 Tax=Natronocella acetinitrilica TaxID=414046 RepID=A0AAE3G5X2_9GAMM|nr:magnesium/cobalt transporter CorA [Natronocella acetinitrilica]MCP1676426.1 magnesium transporter [Natronocella acetinitrilica]